MRSMKTRVKLSFHLILTLAAMLTMAQTAWATDPVTKTYSFSTMTSNGNTISANDPEDNNSSNAIIIAQDGNSKISKVDFLNYIQIANMSGVGGTGADAEFLIYPRINGKVTQIVFTNVSRPSLLGSETEVAVVALQVEQRRGVAPVLAHIHLHTCSGK